MVDGVFLPDHPETLMYTENFKHTNIIAGTNKDEGLIFGLAEFPGNYRPIDVYWKFQQL